MATPPPPAAALDNSEKVTDPTTSPRQLPGPQNQCLYDNNIMRCPAPKSQL